jgi:hypothetical protein
MTPNELLEIALSGFQIVYVESAKQQILLRQALGVYQDKAGVIRKIVFEDDETEADTPDNFLSIVVAQDADGIYHEANESDETITVTAQTNSVTPYTVHYFVNLRDYDADEDLPGDGISLLLDYLVALIAIPNTARERQIATATGLQAELPSDEELRTRKSNLELAMEENQAIIPMVTVC